MNFVPVQYYQNYIEAHIAKGQLEEAGIQCWLKDEHTVTTNPIWTNALGGIKLMVAAHQVDEAQQLLQTIQNDKQLQLKCTRCGSHNIEQVSTPRKASNWISAIISFFMSSYAIAPDKVFHCFDCGYESPDMTIVQE
jgi:predicted RNA-binding Zn-ribbon protein involved in translation (DUF1610 family)